MNRCQFCGQPGTLLCDGRIYILPGGKEQRVSMKVRDGNTRSCDAHLCRQCAKKVADVHSRTRGGCRWDTRDLCPECVKAQEKPMEIPNV